MVKSAVGIANDRVSILDVCRWVGVEAPGDIGGKKSVRVHCPFGEIWHSDHGVQAAFRVYPDSNNSWCFACQQFYDPVSLAAAVWGVEKDVAAVELLDRIGYTPVSLAQAWSEVTHREPVPDRLLLAGALTTYCQRMDHEWKAHQFTAEVAVLLDRCFALLDRVHTDSGAKLWLRESKKIMLRVLALTEEGEYRGISRS